MAKYQVEIDKSTCQGFGACVELCPRFFQLSEIDGKSTLKATKVVMKETAVEAGTFEFNELECLNEGAAACPFNAIHIVNLETGEKLV